MKYKEDNLLPVIESGLWTTEQSATKQLAEFSKDMNNKSLDISIHADNYGLGKWITVIPITSNKTYQFKVTAVGNGVDINDIYALYTISRADGSWIIREHIEHCEVNGNRFDFSGMIEVPEEGDTFKIELWLKGYVCNVKWCKPTLVQCEPVKPRNVRVAIAFIAPECVKEPTIEKNRDMIIQAVDNAGAYKPDIIVLGEAMNTRCVPGTSPKNNAEDENGPMCTLMREKAKKYHTYIIYNFHEKDGKEYYNTSILIGRDGQTVGKYHKTQLTVGEYEEGLTPGNGFPVFKTDFGIIGILICYDHYFPETAEAIVNNGAEIVFVSSAGDAAEKFSARAMDTGAYFAVCGWNTENQHGWGPARVVSPTGDILAQSSENTVPAVCDIDLSKKVRRHWLSVGPADSDFRGIYYFEKNKKPFCKA